MKKLAIVASVWLHVVFLGLATVGTEMLRVEKLPVPPIHDAVASGGEVHSAT